MPVVEEQYSQSSSDGESGNEGFYFRKSKPFQKNPSKIFVGGLPYSTSDDELKRVFSRFGLISEVVVMKDNITKRSRGFGFVTFSDAVSVDMVLDEHERDPIVLNRKKIDPKRAIPKKVTARRTKKVFVGGISSDTSQEDIYDYFKHFGQIIEAMLIVDKTTNKHKGFGFVTYDNYDSVDEICCQQFHNINGKKVETKRAQPKEGTLQKSKKPGEFYVDYSDASKYAYMNYYPPDQFYAMYSPYYGRYVLLPYYPTSTGSAGEQVFAGESYLAQYPNSPDAAAAAYGFWSTNAY